MTEPKRGLTWSGTWHIVDEKRSKDLLTADASLCGTILYNPEKEAAPDKIKEIISGVRNARGECARCLKHVGKKTPSQVLNDDEFIMDTGRYIYDRTQMTLSDAEDLAYDVFQRIKERL